MNGIEDIMYVSVGNSNLTFDNGVITTTDWTSPTITWQPYTYYWPTYTEDKISKAFRVVKVLIDKKIIEVKSAKKFSELVEQIAAEI